MRLADYVVRFSLGTIPTVGNPRTGAIVGLTPDGQTLVESMSRCDIEPAEVPASCLQLVDYLQCHGFLADNDSAAPVVTSAYLHVTPQCNFSCIGCYSGSDRMAHYCVPTVDQLTVAINMLAQLGVQELIYSGGEPFMREDMALLVRRAAYHGIPRQTIITNGSLLSKHCLTSFRGFVQTVALSCDRLFDDEISYLGRDISAADYLVTCDAVRAAGLRPHILLTLHPKNYLNIPRYLALADERGFTIGFSLLSCISSECHDLVFTDEQLQELAEILMSEQVGVGDYAESSGCTHLHGLTCVTYCGAGRRCVSVSYDGTIYPCHMLHIPELRVGNAFVDSGEDVRIGFASHPLQSVDEVPGCKSCDIRYLCGGGCRARMMHASGSWFSNRSSCDPYCMFYQHVIGLQIDRVLGKG